jgi:hypothetical protein
MTLLPYLSVTKRDLHLERERLGGVPLDAIQYPGVRDGIHYCRGILAAACVEEPWQRG